MATKESKRVWRRAEYENTGIFQFDNTVVPGRYQIPADRPTRIFCDGIFDLFHFGHCRLLRQAKNLFPSVYLIVGINSDADAARYKGRPVLSAEERYESVSHCRYVDEIIRDSPWEICEDFLDEHRIDFVVHDAAVYASEGIADIYAVPKQLGRFVPSMRTNGISTTDLITRILRDEKLNFYRQFERGVTREELNVSFFWELWVLVGFQGVFGYLRRKIGRFFAGTKSRDAL